MSPSRSLRRALANDRWLNGPGPLAAAVRFAASAPGQILVNTAAFRLPEELGMGPRTRLLDLACRRASLLRMLAVRARLERPPAGLDPSRRLLSAARRDVEMEGRPKVLLAQGAARAIPFADETFDLVLSAHAFRYLADDELRDCMREARRVLRKGGLFLAWEFAPTRSDLLNRWNRWLLGGAVPGVRLRSYRELRAMARGCGYEWVGKARLRPFLFPPVPRVSIVMGKAPEAWKRRAGADEAASEQPANEG